MRKLVVLGVVAIALVLVGGFVVYPAQAKSQSADRIQEALDDIEVKSGVKLEDVELKTVGNNAFSAVTGGPSVDSVVLRIGMIRVPDDYESATSTSAPTPAEIKQIRTDVNDLYDELGNIGSFTLVLGGVEGGGEKIDFEDSSFAISEDRYRAVLNVSKRIVADALEKAELPLTINAEGHEIKVRSTREIAGFPGDKDIILSAEPIDGGKAVRFGYNGEKHVQRLDPKDGVTVSEIDFDSTGQRYSIVIGGGYTYKAFKRAIDDLFESRDSRRAPIDVGPGAMPRSGEPPGNVSPTDGVSSAPIE